jgi:hypothetical protein
MRRTASIVAALVLMSGLSLAQQEPPTTQITGVDELVTKEKGAFLQTWIRPDVDITRYSKLLVWQTQFQFRDVGETPRSMPTSMLRHDLEDHFTVREEERQRFQQVVNETLVEELERSKMFEVVDTPGPGTLILNPMVADIVSNVPPQTTGLVDVYLSAVGEATIFFELIDAQTGVILARAGERRRIQPPDRLYEVSRLPANSATIWADVKRWSADVGRDLRVALDKAKKTAQKSAQQ